MKMIETMKAEVEAVLNKVTVDVVGGEVRTKIDKETGATEVFCRYKLEVPRGNGKYSRKRFEVKVKEPTLKFNPEDLDEHDYVAKLVRLKISYFDSKSIYFTADGIEIERL